MTDKLNNVLYTGSNTATYTEAQYVDGLTYILNSLGMITSADPEDLKHQIATVGANDLKIIFKITVEQVEYVGQRQ
jgi:hypothetical protein